MSSVGEMDEILQDFIIETSELLDSLDEDLVLLEKNPKDENLLNKVFRTFHTIKGSSSFLGFGKITQLTHKLEDLLNLLRRFELELNPLIMDAILKSTDKLKSMVELIKQGESLETVDLQGEIELLLKAQANETQTGSLNQEIVPEKTIETQELTEKELEELQIQEITKEAALTRNTKMSDEELDAEIAKLLQQRMKEDEEKRKAKHQTQTQSAPQDLNIEVPAKKTQETLPQKEQITNSQDDKPSKEPQTKQDLEKQTIRVDVKKLDDLMDLAGELVLAKNRLVRFANIASENNNIEASLLESLSNISSQITLVTTDMQMAIMKTRMVEIGKVFNRFPRVVRDICRDLKKEVNLIIKGANTELDKSVVEEINEPFVHLIRNAIDHGIESPEERIAKGKNKIGTITLDAAQEGNHIVISVEDDGRGMDKDRILQKAIANGIVTPQEASQMSENDIFNLVFLPGFSTAVTISNISGRGVGMDVVKTNIEKLNGIITIKSKKEVGTKVIIKIPLTLAIIQSLLVKITGSLFAIPLANVTETVRIKLEEIESVQNKDVLRLRGFIVPLVYLGDILKISKDKKTLTSDEIYVVIVSSAEKQIGLVVDALVNQEEVVIKPLGNYLGKVRSIAGATIMGDGSVALILDVVSIVKEASKITSNIRYHIANSSEIKNQIVVISKSDRFSMLSFIKDQFEAYKVAFESNMDALYQTPAALIFLDLSLPNSMELINEIRDLPTTKKSYIVGISDNLKQDKLRFEESSLNAIISIQDRNTQNIKKLLTKNRKTL